MKILRTAVKWRFPNLDLDLSSKMHFLQSLLIFIAFIVQFASKNRNCLLCDFILLLLVPPPIVLPINLYKTCTMNLKIHINKQIGSNNI